MIVQAPVKLGEIIKDKDRNYTLKSISWFYWTYRGYEFTYSLHDERIKSFSPAIHLLTCKGTEPEQYHIDDILLTDGPLKEKGYPFKGKGYIVGMSYINGKKFVDIFMSSKYGAHVYCECNECGEYINNGDVYLPPTWSEGDKRTEEILAKYIGKIKIGFF